MQFSITKGYDIKLAGDYAKETANLNVSKVGYTLEDFPYIKPKVLVEEGQKVKKGEPLFCDKNEPEITFVSPVSGVVDAVARGDRRKLLSVSVNVEGNDSENFEKINTPSIASLGADAAKQALLARGLWPFVRQRPYSKIADPKTTPDSIFVSALDSNPLSANPNEYLADRGDDFKAGITLLKQMTEKVFVCVDGNGSAASAFNVEGVENHSFSGPHPRSNVSLHIEKLDPILSGEKIVWFLRAQDVVAIGKTLTSGTYDSERTIAWAGPAAKERKYYKTTHLACLDSLPKDESVETRVISGGVLSGRSVQSGGFLGCYDHTVTCLEEGRKRRFLGWLTPGFKTMSFTRTFLSTILAPKSYTLNTSLNGGHRAVVESELFDKVQPLSVPTMFMFKSLLAKDVEECERMGLWGLAPEDFALATVIDPCKNDYGAALQDVLDMLHKES